MKTLFISLIPDLIDEKGHQFSYHQAVKKALNQLSIPHHAYVHKQCHLKLPKNWNKYFHKKNNQKTNIFQTMLRFFDFSKLFLKYAKNRQSIFFIESYNTADFIALSLAAFLFRKKKQHLWILFRYDLPLHSIKTKIQLFLFRSFKKRIQGLTDTELLKEWFAKKKLQLQVVPIPHTEIPPRNNVKNSPPFTCLWPGEPRYKKGLPEIKHILEYEDHAAKHFKIVVSETAPLRDKNNLYKIKSELKREEYVKWILKSDFILLPYDPTTYKRGSSGIFVESVIAGAIPLVKEGSWLAEELKKYNLYELIIDWKQDDFFSKLLFLKQNAEILHKLRKMRKAYQNYHSINSYAHIFKKCFEKMHSD